MPAPRAPWWMYVVAASFFAFFAFTMYADFAAPEAAGLSIYDFSQGNLHITAMTRGSPLARAGVEPGDRVITVDDDAVRALGEWVWHRLHFRAAVPIDLGIARSGTRVHKALVLNRRVPFSSLGSGRVSYVAWRAATFSFLFISLFVFLRPDDLSARLGSLTLATFAAALPILAKSYGWAAAFQDLPRPVALLLLIPSLSTALAPAVGFSLFAVFPRDYFSSRRQLLAMCAPQFILAAMVFQWFWPLYQAPALLRAWQGPLVTAYNTSFAAYVGAGYVVLALNYRRLQDQNDRRRVRAIVPPALIFWVISLHVLVAQNWVNWFGTTPPVFFSSLAFAVDGVLIQIFPLSLAYVTLKHRLFNVTVVIRRGIQYALARRVVVSILPAAGLLLLVDVVGHHDQTIGAVLSQRGWLYGVVGGLALVAQQKQHTWLDALDRRFFRERYNAQRILREVADEIRQASSIEQVAGRVVTRIAAALHPEFAAMLVRGANETAYHALACAPDGLSPPLMQADSKLVGLLRLLGKPLQISTSESGWLKQQLPHEDTDFLWRARIDLLVPISLSAFGREALVALGQKKSEEPYGSEDQELLLAIASALALLLERPAGVASASGLEECPVCGSCFDSGVGRCSLDDTRLTSSAVPRVLTGRYRLDRRLDRGGMGTVYSALDTTLERQVALKLIREDLVSSPDAADRFRREAKAAAAVTHPNLVTLHDYAVDAKNRAFLVMELLSGVTLRQRLREQQRLPTPDVVEVVRGVCSALAIVHQRGLIHRDLKPENIFLVTEHGRMLPKLLDFGLAKFVASAEAATETAMGTGVGLLVGTPKYMSPEQLEGKAVSPQWDLWALAVITYEMAVGAYPFGDPGSVAALHASILAGRFTPIDRHRPDATPWPPFGTCPLW